MKISETASGVNISIPARRVWPIVLLQSFFAFGMVFQCKWSSADTMSIVFMAILIVGLGGFFICMLLARETVLCSQREFSYKLHFGPFTFDQEYDPEEVSNFRLYSDSEFGQGMRPEGSGKLCFNYKTKTHRFGLLVVDEAEADQILDVLRRATS